MEMEFNKNKEERLRVLIEKTRNFYNLEKEIWCPYFKTKIVLNSDGFNHLLNKPNRLPRNVDEQLLKLNLLKKALFVIKNTGTVQEIREIIERISRPSKDGFCKTKKVQYWAFHAILGDQKLIKIVVIIKRIGDGNLMFWSVLPHKKFNNQKLYSEDINND